MVQMSLVRNLDIIYVLDNLKEHDAKKTFYINEESVHRMGQCNFYTKSCAVRL